MSDARVAFLAVLLASIVIERASPALLELQHAGTGLSFLDYVHMYLATAFVARTGVSYVENRVLPQDVLVGKVCPHMTFIAGREGWDKYRSKHKDLKVEPHMHCIEVDLAGAFGLVRCQEMHNPIVMVPCLSRYEVGRHRSMLQA